MRGRRGLGRPSCTDVVAGFRYMSTRRAARLESRWRVLLCVDVTEKEERDALRREFSANVSHELKTPLTTIFGTRRL